jgi:hypothetical protein
MKSQPDTEFAAFIGIDWADAKHDICLQVADTEKREFDVLVHRADAIEQWASRSDNAVKADLWPCAWS